MNWQPIETAPKDGTKILLCRAMNADGKPITGGAWGVFVQVAAWWAGDDDWIVYCSLVREPSLHFTPTHWMPLPSNPYVAASQPSSAEVAACCPRCGKSCPVCNDPYMQADQPKDTGK